MSIFLKFSNCCLIIARNIYIKNIQYCKNYFHYGLSVIKTNYLLVLISEDIPISNFNFFKKIHFSQVFKLLHNYSPNYLFWKHSYCKIYFHYGLGLTKTSYNDSASFFWKIFPFQTSVFSQKCPLFSIFQIAA